MNYAYHIFVLFTIYGVLGLSLNMMVGYCGRVSLCHGSFYGLGAFAVSLLVMRADWSYLLAIPVTGGAAAALGFMLGFSTLRLRGDFFVLATIGFQVIAYSVFSNWVAMTGGAYGLPGIPRPVILGYPLTAPGSFAAFAAGLALLAFIVSWQVARSPYGRSMRAVRDDQLVASTLGLNPLIVQASAMALSCMLAAVAGSLWGAWVSYIEPGDFNTDMSITMLALVVIGGAGALCGPVTGAAILVLLPEGIRLIGVPASVAAPVRQMLYGIALILLMRYRRRGLAGGYSLG